MAVTSSMKQMATRRTWPSAQFSRSMGHRACVSHDPRKHHFSRWQGGGGQSEIVPAIGGRLRPRLCRLSVIGPLFQNSFRVDLFITDFSSTIQFFLRLLEWAALSPLPCPHYLTSSHPAVFQIAHPSTPQAPCLKQGNKTINFLVSRPTSFPSLQSHRPRMSHLQSSLVPARSLHALAQTAVQTASSPVDSHRDADGWCSGAAFRFYAAAD